MPTSKPKTPTLNQRVQCLEAIQRVQAGNLDSTDEDYKALVHTVDTVHAMVMAAQTYAYALDRRMKEYEAREVAGFAQYTDLVMDLRVRVEALDRSWGRRLWTWITDDLV